jgi:hypothetical protein
MSALGEFGVGKYCCELMGMSVKDRNIETQSIFSLQACGQWTPNGGGGSDGLRNEILA